MKRAFVPWLSGSVSMLMLCAAVVLSSMLWRLWVQSLKFTTTRGLLLDAPILLVGGVAAIALALTLRRTNSQLTWRRGCVLGIAAVVVASLPLPLLFWFGRVDFLRTYETFVYERHWYWALLYCVAAVAAVASLPALRGVVEGRSARSAIAATVFTLALCLLTIVHPYLSLAA
jgi:hypothetical protein